MLYRLARPLLFSLDPESAHDVAMWGIRNLAGWLPRRSIATSPAVTVMGISFPNRIGLAAGLDKNGEAIDGLAGFGFGHIEIGTVTPRAQPGNPKPRMFRIPNKRAIINRMGFNNDGVDNLLAHVKASRYTGVLGINIGKNFDTPIERAGDDYLACLAKVYPVASYVSINISSPNTLNLRQLQDEAELGTLLARLKRAQAALANQHGRYVPLALKIAPDLDDQQICRIADTLRRHQVDGVIATNTTSSRHSIVGERHANEAGGLSGAPLRDQANAVIQKLAHSLAGELPIIGVGGVTEGIHAREKLHAGAALVQIYSGFIYGGPRLIRECIAATATSE